MQLPDKSGIACDMCGMSHSNDFTYYSMDCKQVSVYSGRLPSLESLLRLRTTHSLDICPACFSDMKESLVAVNAKRANKPKVVFCELSGAVLSGNYEYYYCVVAEVSVRINNNGAICAKCKSPSNGKPCKCGSIDFIRPATVTPTYRYVEFGASHNAMQDMITKMNAIRTKNNQWTTTS